MSGNRNTSIVGGALGVEGDFTPEQIANHDSWSDQQKLERLEKMKMDALEKHRAASEGGMTGDEPADLRGVELAIDSVKNNQSSPDTDGVAGRRLA